MAVFKEIWVADIAANIFRDNSFIVRSKDDSQYVDGKVVHLPQSGTKPGVVKNRATFPGTATQRTDNELTYVIDSYTTDPMHLLNADEMQVSYDKRQSIIGDHTAMISERVADWILYYWTPSTASRMVASTGGAKPATAPSAAGNRKKVVLLDIINAKRKLDTEDIPQEGRVMVVPAEMFNDILEIEGVISADKFGQQTIVNGVVAKLLGFDIYIRSRVAIVDTSGAPDPKTPTDAGGADDSHAILLYHPMFVRRAMGEVKLYVDEDSPIYYGDVFSAEVLAGGQKSYTDSRGIVLLYEAVAP